MDDSTTVATRRTTRRALRFDDKDSPTTKGTLRLSSDTSASQSISEKKVKQKVLVPPPSWNGKSIASLWKRYDLTQAISSHDREEFEALKRYATTSKAKRGEISSKIEGSKNLLFDKGYTDEEWNRMYKSLIMFRKEHFHTGIPPLWDENPELALWAQRQRQIYRETVGSNFSYRKFVNAKEAARIQRLHSIKFIWDYQIFSWDTHFAKLKTIITKARSKYSPYQKISTWSILGNEILSDDMKTWIDTQMKGLEHVDVFFTQREEKLAELFQMSPP
jgi:Helicase associated domain